MATCRLQPLSVGDWFVTKTKTVIALRFRPCATVEHGLASPNAHRRNVAFPSPEDTRKGRTSRAPGAQRAVARECRLGHGGTLSGQGRQRRVRVRVPYDEVAVGVVTQPNRVLWMRLAPAHGRVRSACLHGGSGKAHRQSLQHSAVLREAVKCTIVGETVDEVSLRTE